VAQLTKHKRFQLSKGDVLSQFTKFVSADLKNIHPIFIFFPLVFFANSYDTLIVL